MSDTDGWPNEPDWYDIELGRDELGRFTKRYQPTAMELIYVGDRVITRDGYEAVVEEKLGEVNLLSVRRVDDDTITGLLAPEEVIVVAKEDDDATETVSQ